MRTLLSLCKPYLRSCGVLLPLLLAPTFVMHGVAHAQPTAQQPDPAARQAFEDGRTFYDHGRFADALRKFQESYALSNNPKLLFNIGRAADSEGEQAQAFDAYTAYLQRVPNADNREFVEARLAKLKAAGAAAPANAAPVQTVPAPPPAQVDAPIDPYPPAYVSPGAGKAAPIYGGPVAVAQPIEQSRPDNFPGRFRLYGGLRVGVAGTFHIEDDTDSTYDDDLKSSIGGQLGAELVPVRFFGIGLEARFISFKEKLGATRDLLVDIALKPSFRVALRRIPLEFYGALPFGVTIPSVDDPVPDDDASFDFKVGGNLGFVAGANYFVTKNLGLNFELGALIHWYSADVLDDDEGAFSFSYTLTQFTLLTLNAVYAL